MCMLHMYIYGHMMTYVFIYIVCLMKKTCIRLYIYIHTSTYIYSFSVPHPAWNACLEASPWNFSKKRGTSEKQKNGDVESRNSSCCGSNFGTNTLQHLTNTKTTSFENTIFCGILKICFWIWHSPGVVASSFETNATFQYCICCFPKHCSRVV